MNYILLMLISCWSILAIADDEHFPGTCQTIAIQDATVKLKAPQPTLVLIHNSSASDLWLTHPVAEPSASAGWTSKLDAGKWSALALNKDGFELSCIESKPGHEQQIPCEGMITACDWPAVTMPDKAAATFWAGENMSLSALTAYLGGHGFKLPALAQ